MLNEMLAKITAREKMIGIGAIVSIVAWLIGLIFATKSECVTFLGQTTCVGSINFFTHEYGASLGLIAMLAAIAALVVIYLKYAPNMKINWPAPLPVIFLVLGVVALACSALMVLLGFLDAKDVLGDLGIMFWVADIGMLVGGALMAWPAYQDWTASKV